MLIKIFITVKRVKIILLSENNEGFKQQEPLINHVVMWKNRKNRVILCVAIL